ncbi:MAG: hypothetical protein P8124_11420 [Gammaproteobacteria bacterium]
MQSTPGCKKWEQKALLFDSSSPFRVVLSDAMEVIRLIFLSNVSFLVIFTILSFISESVAERWVWIPASISCLVLGVGLYSFFRGFQKAPRNILAVVLAVMFSAWFVLLGDFAIALAISCLRGPCL